MTLTVTSECREAKSRGSRSQIFRGEGNNIGYSAVSGVQWWSEAFGSVGQCFHRTAQRNTGLQAQAQQAFTEDGPNRQGHGFRLNSLRN